jgi:hypothetical protein
MYAAIMEAKELFRAFADDSINLVAFGHDKVSVDQIRLQVRVGSRRHDQNLVNIGHENVFPPLTVP